MRTTVFGIASIGLAVAFLLTALSSPNAVAANMTPILQAGKTISGTVVKPAHCCHSHPRPPYDRYCCHSGAYVAPVYRRNVGSVRRSSRRVGRRTGRRVSRRRR